MQEEPSITIREAAEWLKVSPDTIRRRIWDESLVAYKIGGKYRIKESDLDAFVDSGRSTYQNGDNR